VWEGIFAWNVQSGTARRKALGFIGRKEYREAIGHLKQVEKVDPDDAYIHLFLAMAYVETDQLEAAGKHFDRLMELRNDMVQAQLVLTLEHLDEGVLRYLSTLVRVSLAGGRGQPLERARATMERNAGTVSLLASLHSQWGNALVNRKDFEGSIPHYERATQLEPESPSAFTMLGQIMEINGRPNEALRYYQRAVELDPGGVAEQKLQSLRSRRP
jgi:tetratricopeptide (TPR) repeat protein